MYWFGGCKFPLYAQIGEVGLPFCMDHTHMRDVTICQSTPSKGRYEVGSRQSLSDPAFWDLPREERDETFALLRREEPVSWQEPPLAWAPARWGTPRGYWAVTRHQDVREISRDSTRYRSGRGTLFFDNLPPDVEYGFSGWVSTDAPRHTQLRRLVSKAFSPRGVQQMEALILEEARKAVSRVADLGECDFFHGLARPFAIGVTCRLLGVPDSDRDEIVRLVNRAGDWGGGEVTVGAIEAGAEATRYGIELARKRRQRPKDDLITEIANVKLNGEILEDEDVGAFFWVLLSAGFDTVATSASYAMVAFDRFPEERHRWQDNFEPLASTAVEEILRWATPVMNFRRVVTADTEIAGQAISEGDNVVMWYVSANRDDEIFDDPWSLDLSRDPNPHLAFGGGGAHFCLGHALARLELKALFGELFRRLPDIELEGEPVPNTKTVPCSFTATELGGDEALTD